MAGLVPAIHVVAVSEERERERERRGLAAGETLREADMRAVEILVGQHIRR
jgi:hypothetical protein